MLKKTYFTVLLLSLLFTCSCSTPYQRHRIDLTTIETAKEIIDSLQTTNALSTSINPFAIPIGAGLAGISAILTTLAETKRREANKQNKSMIKTIDKKLNGTG